LLRYTPENITNPRVVTGKWLMKNKKSTSRIKNKTWTNPQITKNHKKKKKKKQENKFFIFLAN